MRAGILGVSSVPLALCSTGLSLVLGVVLGVTGD